VDDAPSEADDTEAVDTRDFEQENIPAPSSTAEAEHAWAMELQSEAEQMLKELGLFKRKVREDQSRFPILREISAN
jgi:hypothetical protein